MHNRAESKSIEKCQRLQSPPFPHPHTHTQKDNLTIMKGQDVDGTSVYLAGSVPWPFLKVAQLALLQYKLCASWKVHQELLLHCCGERIRYSDAAPEVTQITLN
jgi:hypothetical protein